MNNQDITEKLDPRKNDIGDYIDDFMQSDAPQFKGKSKDKIKDMAIAAYYNDRKEAGLKEDTDIIFEGLSEVNLSKYKDTELSKISVAFSDAGVNWSRDKLFRPAIRSLGKELAKRKMPIPSAVKAAFKPDELKKLLGESTLNWARSMRAIEKQQKMANLSPKDKDTLRKIADLMKRANEEVDEEKEMDPTKHVSKKGDGYIVVNKDGKVVKNFDNKDDADKYAIDNHDELMESVELEEAPTPTFMERVKALHEAKKKEEEEDLNEFEINRLKPDRIRDQHGEIILTYNSSSDMRNAAQKLDDKGISTRRGRDGKTLEVDSNSKYFRDKKINRPLDSGKRQRTVSRILGESKMDEEDQEEGNAFGAAVMAAKKKGAKEFIFAGKKYMVKEYVEEAKRMKYDKVIKKLRDGEWDTSMDVKKRNHLTYTDNNTGKEKVVFVEADELEEAFVIDKGAKVVMKLKNGKMLYGKVLKQQKVLGKAGVEVQWSNGIKGRFPTDQFSALSMNSKADFKIEEGSTELEEAKEIKLAGKPFTKLTSKGRNKTIVSVASGEPMSISLPMQKVIDAGKKAGLWDGKKVNTKAISGPDAWDTFDYEVRIAGGKIMVESTEDLKEYVGPALTPANQIAKKHGGKVKAIMVKDEKGKKTKYFYVEDSVSELKEPFVVFNKKTKEVLATGNNSRSLFARRSGYARDNEIDVKDLAFTRVSKKQTVGTTLKESDITELYEETHSVKIKLMHGKNIPALHVQKMTGLKIKKGTVNKFGSDLGMSLEGPLAKVRKFITRIKTGRYEDIIQLVDQEPKKESSARSRNPINVIGRVAGKDFQSKIMRMYGDKKLNDAIPFFFMLDTGASKKDAAKLVNTIRDKNLRKDIQDYLSTVKEETETHYEWDLDESKKLPFKSLEQAWQRTKGDKDKQAKLIKKHGLKNVISNVRPGEIRLGAKNKLQGSKANMTIAGLDKDNNLIFVTNNPLKIFYPKKSQRRPEGIEATPVYESMQDLRVKAIVQKLTGADSETLQLFLAHNTFTEESSYTDIRKAYRSFINEIL